NQNLRITDQGTGNGGTLFLSAGEGDAALADYRLIALGEALDVGGDVGCFGGVVDLLIGGGVYAKRDVFADAVAEEERFLRHESNIAPQCRQSVIANWP